MLVLVLFLVFIKSVIVFLLCVMMISIKSG